LIVLGKLPIGGSDDAALTPIGVEALSDAPHPPQNWASSGLSLPHDEHFISGTPYFTPHEPTSGQSIAEGAKGR
jgi:hypothetical protein